MLTRAVSAPAKYGGPGILRFPFDNEPEASPSVSFAPLPVPDPDPDSRRHKYKMGVHGRSGILNKQRQHPNGINYRPPPGGGMILSSSAAAAARRKENGSATLGKVLVDGREQSSDGSNKVASGVDLSLRRAASEDSNLNTLEAHRSGRGLKFWKKSFPSASRRPALSTVPSECTVPDQSDTENTSNQSVIIPSSSDDTTGSTTLSQEMSTNQKKEEISP